MNAAIVVFVVFLLLIVLTVLLSRRGARNEEKEQNAYLRENGIYPDADYSYQNSTKSKRIRYLVDYETGYVFVAKSSATFKKIPIDEITGCEIITDSEVTGGVGRALAGALIAGGVGAVVGATTAKKKIQLYKIIIYRSNLKHPSYEIILIGKQTETSSPDYKQAVAFASKVNASIKALISVSKQEAYNEKQRLSSRSSQSSLPAATVSDSHPNYLPGMEPDNIHNLLESFFTEIDEYFPDKTIYLSEWDHDRFDKALNYLTKFLGYKNRADFFEAYGYSFVKDI